MYCQECRNILSDGDIIIELVTTDEEVYYFCCNTECISCFVKENDFKVKEINIKRYFS